MELDDEDIMYYLFEELDSDATSCLHINTLRKLQNQGFINWQTVLLCTIFRSKYLELNAQRKWSAEEIRRDKKWRNILNLADMIKSKLNQ